MDDIQRKLALIDAQLAGRADIHGRIISTAPLLFAAIGLMAGILIQDTVLGPRCTGREAQLRWVWLTLLVISVTAAVFLFLKHKELSPHFFAYSALMCFVCLGAIRMISFCQTRPNDICNLVGDERKLATIRGMIVTDPYTNKQDWAFAGFQFTDPASSFYLKIGEVKTASGWAKAAGVVRARVDEPVPDLKAGDYIQAYCRLDRFKGPTNPAQFNIAEYLARKNIFVAAAIKSRDSIEVLPNSRAGMFVKARTKLREKASQALLGRGLQEDASQGLLEALLLGSRRNIDNDTTTAFRKTGLLHFISLSGMHLGILMVAIWRLCKTIGLMKPAQAAVCMVAVGVFVLIVPPRAPTLRAAIICWVFCASLFFRRRSHPLNTLSLAAIVLLLIRPSQLFEAGWQLSFASVLGVLLFSERVYLFLSERIAAMFGDRKKLKARAFSLVAVNSGSYVLGLFSVGLAAWLGGAGILLYHFYTVNPLTYLWTVLVFPLVAAILTIGFLKMVLAFLLPTAAALLGVMVTALADLLIAAVILIARLGVSEILIGRVPPAPIILYYTTILFMAFTSFGRPFIKKAIFAVMLLMIVVSLGLIKWQRTYRNHLTMTCLDVGHGQAILLQLPRRTNILFDAGSANRTNIGERIVLPFLNRNAVSRIDAVIISHNDFDHLNGIPEIVKGCRVKRVYANDAFFEGTDQWATAKVLGKNLRQSGHKILPVLKEPVFPAGANIKMLWPRKDMPAGDALSDNDTSLVTLIEFAGRKILLCSDIEEFAQTELLRLFPDLKADVIVAAHHGSVRTTNPTFLEELDAAVWICSCSRTEYEKRQTIRSNTKTRCFHTPKDGAVTVCISKHSALQTRVFTGDE
ncbi:MAG: DNA internalization-related competence protein ComEC/Rec2 [Planctomycetota bacterium]|jgi:competence protein ComEC